MACGSQHFVIVAVDGQVGVNIAVTRMHVQRGPHTAFQHAFVRCHAFGKYRQKRAASKNRLKRCFELGFPAGTKRVVL